MRFVRLYWQMLRPRVAVMLLLFAGVGVTFQTKQLTWNNQYLTIFLLLTAWYVNATTVNDISDEAIDKINLKQATGRPLVRQQASRRDLWQLNLLSGGLALACGAFLGLYGLALTCFGLLLNYAYSLRPLQISHRGYIAPLLLPLGYVALPYLLATAGLTNQLSTASLWLLASLYICFVGRILLKDLRDEKGDRAYGKRTMMVMHGKTTVCAIAAVCWLIGDALLIRTLHWSGQLITVQVFLVLVLYSLWAVNRSTTHELEQVHIGLLAKAANGILITLIALFVMDTQPQSTVATMSFVILVLYGSIIIQGLSSPQTVMLGYKG